jgi:hypothetical protein
MSTPSATQPSQMATSRKGTPSSSDRSARTWDEGLAAGRQLLDRDHTGDEATEGILGMRGLLPVEQRLQRGGMGGLDMTAGITSSANDPLYSDPMLLKHARNSFDGLSIAVRAMHHVAVLHILDC